MDGFSRRAILAGAGSVTLSQRVVPGFAQDQALKIIMPFAAGGSADLLRDCLRSACKPASVAASSWKAALEAAAGSGSSGSTGSPGWRDAAVCRGRANVPLWVVLSCQSAMALGTLCGGWRIVRTVGSRITHLTPMQGFCAETGGALALFCATWLGIPVSTTHTITGSIVGVGAARRVSAVRWGVARSIVIAWGITLPASALVAALCYRLAIAFLGKG